MIGIGVKNIPAGKQTTGNAVEAGGRSGDVRDTRTEELLSFLVEFLYLPGSWIIGLETSGQIQLLTMCDHRGLISKHHII